MAIEALAGRPGFQSSGASGAAIVRHLGIEHQVASLERAQLDEIRLSGQPEVPSERLIELYGSPAGKNEHQLSARVRWAQTRMRETG